MEVDVHAETTCILNLTAYSTAMEIGYACSLQGDPWGPKT